MRHAICFVSNKNKEISIEQIEELLHSSSVNNDSSGIKGLLLYSEGNFFQIIEGEKINVKGLFEKIKKDLRHYGIIQVFGRDINGTTLRGYKTDIIIDNLKYQKRLPKKYTDTLEGVPMELKNSMEMMLEKFMTIR